MEKLGKIIHPKDAKVFMDEQELVREYLHTDKITFGVSRLKPGAVGGLVRPAGGHPHLGHLRPGLQRQQLRLYELLTFP